MVMGPRVGGDDWLRDLRWKSHRRRDAIAADIDAGGFQAAVLFPGGAEDDDPGARLQLGPVARDEADDRRIRRHHHFLFAVLVLDQNDLTIGSRNCLGDGGVGHGRVGTEIPGPETFGYAALAFREDLNGERPLGAVGFGHRGDADVRTRLDFRDRGLGDPEYRHIVSQAYLHLGTLARFHLKQGAVHGFDRAPDTYRWGLLCPRRSKHRDNHERSREQTRHQ